METNNLVKSIANRTAQTALFRSVYVWMTLALAITGFVALYVAKSYTLINAMAQNSMMFWILLIAEVGLVMFLSARIHRISFTTATILFILYSVLNGVTMSVLFMVYTMSSIATTFFVTAGTFGATALYGYVTKKDLTRIGSLCIMGVIGLIIASLVNLFLQNSMMDLIISYIGVLLFVGLTAYDSQKIKQLLSGDDVEVNETTQKIALMGSLTLYLDFINLFIYLLRILGDRK
ncbi:Bax inhibitor-1/YccA family protein [Bacteroides gallinaceum]|uniref:Bax inhibitor-1/YccA family protein n=1 Tax=Candidatus Phocaeicola excrementipullorum TaxID=2838731 RepID=A0A948TQM6_9BACT|nr:Bax inhibitor-1/YccA family protein [Bacteroides gallinaceum]MBU3857451.1 Bax inhibitor-1/YccA family protein [Candidatus Phocaeicola excrementipullorum]MBW9200033.1 Bax inhibitor-1/YccA family protein [Bacteroidales bacterium SW299]MDM8206922.1 Bax inhibitor-1/YccA family protein [Bacteroides gallinaceum]